MLLAGHFGCSQQLPVTHSPQREVPLRNSVRTPAAIKKCRCPSQPGVGPCLRQLGGRKRCRTRRGDNRLTELFEGKLPVEVELAGNGFIRLTRLRRIAARGKCARFPVNPGRICFQGRRHLLDALSHPGPVDLTLPQGRAHTPGVVVVA